MLTTTFRLIRYGLKNFIRNGWLSVATVVVMLLALSFFLGLILFRYTTISALDAVKDKIDISVYFTASAPEDEILRIKRVLEDLEEVSSVDYISKDEALERFEERHIDDAAAQALEELDENPFLASLNIKSSDPSKFAVIADYLDRDSFAPVVERVTYAENQLVIDRLTVLINNANTGGVVLTFVLALVAVLVAFNTIWLAMYSNREEIGIMRLVGASNTYVRGPYVVEGIVYGVLAAVLSIILAIPIVVTVSPWLTRFESGIDLASYFFSNLGRLLIYQIIFGILLGAISSFIAIRRYLKI